LIHPQSQNVKVRIDELNKRIYTACNNFLKVNHLKGLLKSAKVTVEIKRAQFF